MNIPTVPFFRLASNSRYTQLNRMLITDIVITQELPLILYQVPFELTNSPGRAWEEILMDIWQSMIRHKERLSDTIIWVFHNRIIIDRVKIELIDELEVHLNNTIEKTNKRIKTKL